MKPLQAAQPERVRVSESAPHALLAGLSLAAAGIHFSVMAEHFAEYVVFGLFFAVVAWLQAVWAVGVIAAPTRPLLVAGLIGNGAVVTIWVISRTLGLPIGPESGVAEPVGFLDGLSTIVEIAIVAGTATLLARRRGATSHEGRWTIPAAVVFTIVLATLSTWAVATEARSQGSSHADGSHGGSVGATEAPAEGQPAFARVELGDGRSVQVLVDSSVAPSQVHLTFFDADGAELAIDSTSLTGVSPAGEERDIPIARYEAGHFVASVQLEPGDWVFRINGVTSDGQPFETSANMTVA